MEACATLGMGNQEAMSKDLESDLFLNSTLQRFTCELYYRFGSFQMLWVPKMAERIEMMNEWLTLSKYAGLGAAIVAELMIGFWFGIGVMLAIGIADSLNHFVGVLTSCK